MPALGLYGVNPCSGRVATWIATSAGIGFSGTCLSQGDQGANQAYSYISILGASVILWVHDGKCLGSQDREMGDFDASARDDVCSLLQHVMCTTEVNQVAGQVQ